LQQYNNDVVSIVVLSVTLDGGS